VLWPSAPPPGICKHTMSGAAGVAKARAHTLPQGVANSRCLLLSRVEVPNLRAIALSSS
jgi:hypothetical protein